MNRFADISAILSPSVVRDIYDDDNCGEPDFEPLLWLEETAEDMFESGVLSAFPSVEVLRANPCKTCARIVGEFVQALAAQRFPRAYGRDFDRLMRLARDSVDRIRTGKDTLAIPAPTEPTTPAVEVDDGFGFACEPSRGMSSMVHAGRYHHHRVSR